MEDELDEQPNATDDVFTTHYFGRFNGALKALRSAEVLGFGVRLHNENKVIGRDEEGETTEETWVLELLHDIPLSDEAEDESGS